MTTVPETPTPHVKTVPCGACAGDGFIETGTLAGGYTSGHTCGLCAGTGMVEVEVTS